MMHPLLSSVHTSNFFLFVIVLAVLPQQIQTIVDIFLLTPGFDRKAAGISLLIMMLLFLLRENYFFRLKTYQYITYFCFIQSLIGCECYPDTFGNISKEVIKNFFLFGATNMVNYINWFSDVQPSLHSWNTLHLVTMLYPFNMMLNSMVYIFSSIFLNDTGMRFLFLYYLWWIWASMNVYYTKKKWELSFFYVLEQFK